MGKRERSFWGPWAAVVSAGALTFLVGAMGHDVAAQGTAATQPVIVAPVAAGGAWAWFVANSGWLVPLAVTVLSSLATGLSDYPKAGGFVKVLRVVVASLGVVQFRDAPGSLKAPLTPPSRVQ